MRDKRGKGNSNCLLFSSVEDVTEADSTGAGGSSLSGGNSGETVGEWLKDAAEVMASQ